MKEIRAKKFKTVNGKNLLVTVDISKATHMGYYRCPDGTEAQPFEFYNNGREFDTFWNIISKAKESHDLDEIVVGFESTGSYGEPLVHYLRKKKVQLVQVNPMHTKRVKELQGNSPNKTDKKDPKVIADIIELGHALTVIIPEGVNAELRRLTHGRERSVQRRTALFNQLQDLLVIIFPEFLQVMKDVKTKSARHLLKRYPAPRSIVRCGRESLTGTLRKVSRGRLGRERAAALYEAAKNSVGIEEGRDSILFEIKEILAGIEASERFIARIEERIGNYLEEVPYSKFILSIKGIGEVTSAGLIGEVGDFSKFTTIGEIEKLAGLDLFEISSGKHKGNRRISKRGRPLMRKLLYFASLNVVRKGGIMHDYYQRCLKRGMVKTKALIAVARKLLGIIFALVRDHSDYRENYATTAPEMKEAV